MRPPRTNWPSSSRPVTIRSRARFDRDDRMPYMKMNWIYVFAAAALVIRAVARLETIQYTVERVITAESGEGLFGFLFRDRVLLVAHGYVIAGIDLGRLLPSD